MNIINHSTIRVEFFDRGCDCAEVNMIRCVPESHPFTRFVGVPLFPVLDADAPGQAFRYKSGRRTSQRMRAFRCNPSRGVSPRYRFSLQYQDDSTPKPEGLEFEYSVRLVPTLKGLRGFG
jgi:hypothetical protein